MSSYWNEFAPYVPKAQKIKIAEKTRASMAKKGVILEPVIVEGRKIAQTWWGKAWIDNLERYADYSNRVPRGRSYLRNGSVLDLKISLNRVVALISGSRPKPYTVEVSISSLDKKAEKKLIEKSRASLDSIQALLSGDFPADLKEEFFKQGTGLFPSPKEIKLDCTCPDWAEMCKHVAAALYGAAVRLDKNPELFFTLRGIKIESFVDEMVKEESDKIIKKSKRKSERAIISSDSEIAGMFGIVMETPEKTVKSKAIGAKTKKRSVKKSPVSVVEKSVRGTKKANSGKKV